jgi:hypothetical protein
MALDSVAANRQTRAIAAARVGSSFGPNKPDRRADAVELASDERPVVAEIRPRLGQIALVQLDSEIVRQGVADAGEVLIAQSAVAISECSFEAVAASEARPRRLVGSQAVRGVDAISKAGIGASEASHRLVAFGVEV